MNPFTTLSREDVRRLGANADERFEIRFFFGTLASRLISNSRAATTPKRALRNWRLALPGSPARGEAEQAYRRLAAKSDASSRLTLEPARHDLVAHEGESPLEAALDRTAEPAACLRLAARCGTLSRVRERALARALDLDEGLRTCNEVRRLAHRHSPLQARALQGILEAKLAKLAAAA